jgi:hypothetical protein
LGDDIFRKRSDYDGANVTEWSYDLIIYNDVTPLPTISGLLVADVHDSQHLQDEPVGESIVPLRASAIICDKSWIFTYDCDHEETGKYRMTGEFKNIDTGQVRTCCEMIRWLGGYYGVVIVHRMDDTVAYYDIAKDKWIKLMSFSDKYCGYHKIWEFKDMTGNILSGIDGAGFSVVFYINKDRSIGYTYFDWCSRHGIDTASPLFPEYYHVIKNADGIMYEWSCGLLVIDTRCMREGCLRSGKILVRKSFS